MRMIEVNDYKGFIQCPFCKEKAMVKKGTRGQASHRCKCGKILMFDYDSMTAELAGPLRGGSKYFTDKKNTDHRLSR